MAPDTRPFLRAYLREAPLFAAVVRPVEAALVGARQPLAEPILDLGCGDGLFASVALGGLVCDGLDRDAGCLRESRSRRAHRFLVQSDGASLPFRDGVYGTVLANSVLEHIPELEPTLGEAVRVLRRGGRLLVTAPSHRFADWLLLPTLLRAAGLPGAARRYGAWFNRHSRHYHTDDTGVWTDRLRRLGLVVTAAQLYLAAPAMRWFDALHYLSLLRLAHRRLFGRWILFRGGFFNPLWEKRLAGLCRSEPVEEGADLFVEARKP